MEHTLNNLIRFTSSDDKPKHDKIRSFHYDHSGHVVVTNSHVLFATKKPFEIKRAGRTFSKQEYEKGYFVESKFDFPEWKKAVPEESAKKITIMIPEWFELFGDEDRSGTIILDYSNPQKAFLKLSDSATESCFAFNMKYLSSFAGEEISFLVSSPILPAAILSKDSIVDPLSKTLRDDILQEDWFYILMPIKLDEEESNEVYM